MRTLTVVMGALLLAAMASAAVAEEVQFDLSAGFNFDAVGTVDEVANSVPWYNYWLVEDEPRVITPVDRYNRTLCNMYTDPANLLPLAGDEWYDALYHHDAWSTWCTFKHDPADPEHTLQQVVSTDYGTYALGAFDSGVAFDPENPQSTLPASPNVVRLGTMKGKYHPADPEGYAEETVMLPPEQQGRYFDVNFLLEGDSTGEIEKRAYFRIYAIYQGTPNEEVLIFACPDVSGTLAGGVPGQMGLNSAYSGDWNAAFLAWNGVQIGTLDETKYYYRGGGTPYYSRSTDVPEGSYLWLWEPNAAGIVLDSSKTLLGFKFEIDNGASGYCQAETVEIFAAVGHSWSETVGDPDATTSSVTADPTEIPNDDTTASTITIVLKDADNATVTGKVNGDFTVTATGGTGYTVGDVTETAIPGTYECTLTSDTAANLTVTVQVATSEDPVTLDDQPAITVYAPGTQGYPLADAGPDQEVTDADGGGYEEVALDGSGSYDSGGDNPGLVNYLWTVGTTVLYDGANSVALVDLTLGMHQVVLTVEDGDGNTHSDTVTITVSPAEGDAVPLDISAGFNFDAVGTKDEVDVADAWYAYYSVADPDRVLYDGLLNKTIYNMCNDPLNTVPIAPDEWYYGIHHMFFYNTSCYAHVPLDLDTLQPVVVTDYGAYGLGDFDAGAALGTLQSTMPVGLNAIRLGTKIAHYHPADPEGYAEETVLLPVGQQGHYQDVNFLVSGTSDGAMRDENNPRKRAAFCIYAIYQGTPNEEVLIFESPRIAIDWDESYGPGSPDNDIAGGVPSPWGLNYANQAFWHPDFLAAWDDGIPVGIRYYYRGGSPPYYSRFAARAEGDYLWMWEPSTTGLALNASKTLLGFRFSVDNGPNLASSGYLYGDTVNVYAASATPGTAAPLEVTAALAAGEDWVYQNTVTTTADRHTSLATIILVSEASPGEVYNVSIADDGPGTNFTLGAITDNRPGQQTLTVPIVGGRVGASTPGAGGAAYNVTLTVEGQTSTQSDTADVTLALRYIGDVDGSGAPGAQDKQFFNQRLNNVATAYPDRCYDLNGSGGAPNAEDKQVMNQVLNGVALP